MFALQTSSAAVILVKYCCKTVEKQRKLFLHWFSRGENVRIADIVSALIGMTLSAAAYLYTFTFKRFKNVPVGPEVFPRWLAVCLFACCVVLLIKSLKNKNDKSEAPAISPMDKNIQRMLIGLGIVVISALLWNVTGFLITTPFSLFLFMWLLGKRDVKFMIIISVAATAIIFCAFRFILGIEMPMGFLDMLNF